MFSEYASRFLAQSQSRLLGAQDTADNQNRTRSARHSRGQGPGASRHYSSRSYLQKPTMPNPYGPTGSQMSRFPFASRTSAAPAPLFYSATDDFREEDDGEEHEREVADFYALQKSRRQFGGSHLTESSETDGEGDRSLNRSHGDEDDSGGPAFGRGIRSSWRGGRITSRGRDPNIQPIEEGDGRGRSVGASDASAPSSKGKGRLVDVELASTEKDSADEFQNDLSDDDMDPPPTHHHFRRVPGIQPPRNPLQNAMPIPLETDEEAFLGNPRPMSPDRETVVTVVEEQQEKHDSFWSFAFVIAAAAYFGTAVLVWMHTSAPDQKHPLGDTVYSTLHSSFHLLSAYTLVSIVVAAFWLACLAYFVRPLVRLIMVGVPVILISFFLYPLISSYKGAWHGHSVQDKAMRWLSLLPGICAAVWIYTVYQGRRSIDKASRILELASRVLGACPALLLVGLGVLATTVVWTWIWIGIFARLFLEGHFKRRDGKVSLWAVDLSTWWLGIFYILFYLWSLGVISGIQRSLTSATVSQWYFHRYAVPKPTSHQVVHASFWHATGPMFGTICLSTFLTLALRLPLIVLPRRFAALISFCVYQLIPSSVVTLTNPLTLTYASIHSMDLRQAAHGLGQMSFVSKSSPTTTLTPRSFSSPSGHELVPYRLSKLLLHATRFVMSLALGFGGWVSTARALELSGSSHRGSLYAYVVGMVAAAIGWSVLGAMEGALGGILDALIVCWGSEVGTQGAGQSKYCREAGELFGESEGRWS